MTDSIGRRQSLDAAAAKKGFARLQQGICVSVDWETGLATINVGGGQVPMPVASDVPPTPQSVVWVGFLGQFPVCLGSEARPATGTVNGPAAGGLVPVTGADGVTYSLAYDERITDWTSGTPVLIYWPGGGTVLFPLSADPFTHNDLLPAPPVIQPPTSQTVTFNPIDSGTQNGDEDTGSGGSWSSQVWCGDTTIGAYYYGNQFGGIPANAVITGISMYLDQAGGFGDPPSIGMHSTATKGGSVTVGFAVTISPGSGWKSLPIDFANAFKAGTAKGLGTHHGGEYQFSPAGVNNSGAVTISWTV